MESTNSTVSTELCPPMKKRKVMKMQSRKVCITLNNYSEVEYAALLKHCADNAAKWIIGKEVGEDKKTPHLQGYIHYKTPRNWDTLLKVVPRAHLEKAKGSDDQNYKYCSKEGDFRASDNMIPYRVYLRQKKLNRKFKNVVWRDWQQRILEDIKAYSPESRKINWYWCSAGNSGKSFLASFIGLSMKGVICVGGKTNDIFNQVNTMIENREEPKIIIQDVPRYSKDYINYSALETLKNGDLYSGKYEGGMCNFDEPYVIVFANEEPDQSKMSRDRWNIVSID